jgi:hypothetical protein
VTALFYQLFKPVGRSLALIAVFLSLMGLAPQVKEPIAAARGIPHGIGYGVP